MFDISHTCQPRVVHSCRTSKTCFMGVGDFPYGLVHFNNAFLYYEIWPAFVKWHENDRSVQNTSKEQLLQIF